MCNDKKRPYYDIDNLLPVLDMEGKFIDFAQKTGHPIIVDYSQINREIVIKNNGFPHNKIRGIVQPVHPKGQGNRLKVKKVKKVMLGNPKEKECIDNIDELRKMVSMYVLTVFNSKHKVNAYVSRNDVPRIDMLYDDFTFEDDINVADYEKPILPTQNERYISEMKEIAPLLTHQVMFDILYNKYLEESPVMTLNKYCSHYIDYNRGSSGSSYNMMREEIKREIDIMSNSALKADAMSLGVDPDLFVKFIGKHIPQKPKHVWDYIYYNGCPDLITSKQYKRNFRRDSNTSYDVFIDNFCNYDKFVGTLLPHESDKDHDFFRKSMDYYHLESYKRLDFAYKLAVRIESADLIDEQKEHLLREEILREHFLVKRFTPSIFLALHGY